VVSGYSHLFREIEEIPLHSPLVQQMTAEMTIRDQASDLAL
jgi:hypothetical protein